MSLSLCDFCKEVKVRLSSAMGSGQLQVQTALTGEEYNVYLEDKNGNMYLNEAFPIAGNFILNNLDEINPTDFQQVGRDITVQPLQFDVYSYYIFTVTLPTSAVSDTLPILMPDGNEYACLLITFYETTDIVN